MKQIGGRSSIHFKVRRVNFVAGTTSTRRGKLRSKYALFLVVLTTLLASSLLPYVFDASAHAQSAYRWRNDDGSQTDATFAATENTSLSAINRDSAKRLRLGAANSGSESELLRKAATALHGGVNYIRTGVVDVANGYAYFGTNTTPGQVLKVALGSGSNEPALVASLTLNSGENALAASAIDTTNGYAYFGTFTTPGQVIKVALGSGASAPTRIGSVSLGSGENSLISGAVDTTNGYAYFGTFTSPGRVVKVALGAGAAAPTRTAALILNSGEDTTYTSVVDSANGYGYFGTVTSPAFIVKVALGAGAAAPTRVAALTLNSGENQAHSAVIDTTNGYAYIGTNTSPAIVVKVALGAGAAAPTRAGAVTLNSGENMLVNSATIDVANGYAYFGTYTSPAIVVKVALGAGAAAPTRAGAVTLNTGESFIVSAVIDPTNGYAYFGTDTATGIVIKVALGAGAAAPTRTASLPLTSINNVYSSVIDTVNGYAYFGTNTSPAKVIKMKLGAGDAAPTQIGAITMPTGENALLSAAIDTTNGYAYFGANTSPAKIIKIALGAGDAAPSRVGSLTLNSGENTAYSAVLDSANGYGYFGMLTSPGIVVKVALGAGNAVPTRTAALTLNSGENQLVVSAAIDTTNGYAYFGTNTIPGIVVKVNLGAGAAAPTRTGAVTLNSGEESLRGTAIDVANGYAYFVAATAPSPGRVVKVALGAGAAAPTRTGAVTLSGSEAPLSAAIDTVNGFLYVGTENSPANVVKVSLGAGAAAPTRITAVTMSGGENSFYTATIDPTNGYAYFPSYTSPTNIVKVSTTPKSTFRLEYGARISTCAAIASWTQVPTIATTEHWAMSDSANITNGVATTNIAGLTDGNTSFKVGEIHDTTSQTALYSLGEKEFTELEFNIKPTSNANSGSYCFRLSNAGTALATYTNYAEAGVTVPLVTAISHTPTSPTVGDAVTLSATATDGVGITSMEIYLDGTAPGNLKQTCTFGGTSPATCSVIVGPLPSGSHTTTVKAYNAAADVGTDTDTFSVSSVGGSTCPTTGNNITIAASCTLAAGTFTYTGTLTVLSGATVTTLGNTGGGTGVIINSGSIDVQSGGSISADANGFTGGGGSGVGSSDPNGGGGGGYGGRGGNGAFGTSGGAGYGSVTQPTSLGSAGGGNASAASGPAGGGAIKLVATGTLTVNGTVSANGQNASNNATGGGAGGSVWLDGNTLAGSGTVRANGAAGIGGSGAGGGGGGRVAIYSSASSQTWTTQAYGGGCNCGNGSQSGGAGTIYVRDYATPTSSLTVANGNTAGASTTQVTTTSQTYGAVTVKDGAAYIIPNTFTLSATGTFTGGGSTQPSLTINSGGTFNPPSATQTISSISVTNNGTVGIVTALTLTSASFTHNGTFSAVLANLTVGSSGTFSQSGTTTLTLAGTLTVQSGGTLTHGANSSARANVINITAATIDIQSDGTVSADAKGFTGGNGTGVGSSDPNGGGGGGYGGNGGNGAFGTLGGTTYGTASQPTDLGSAGGGNASAASGPAGGGAIKLVATGTLTVNGTVSANGQNASNNATGGASGGSIWLTGNTLAGSGTLRVNGGSGIGGTGAGGGGGGRIAGTYVTSSTQSWTTQVLGGSPSGTGFAGSDGTSSVGPSSSVTVTAPDGSESLAGGQPFNITWTSDGTIDHFRISLSTNGGSSYGTSIVTSTPSSPYAWTVNNITTSTARIKVEAMDGSNAVLTSDTSNANFSITASALTLTAPNGDEHLLGGGLFNLTWTSSGLIDHYRVKLSADGGSTFPTTVTSSATGSSYLMTVPSVTTIQGIMQIEGLDASNNVLATDVSDAIFTIDAQSVNTTANVLTFSRLKIGTTATFSITFNLYHDLASTLTVTFPAAFTVLSAGTDEASSSCLSNFDFTATTLTADKTNCSGPIILGGATVELPSSAGSYAITWVNDDPGQGGVIVTDEDQISVTAAVDPVITFNVGAQASATACDGTFSANGGTVALGAITTSAVTTSDEGSISHICSRLSTNSSAGATISVRNVNGASGLVSTSVPAATIPTSTATLTAGTPGYGLCGGSAVGDSGKDTTDPIGSTPTAVSPFNGSCTTSAHVIGGFLTTAQTVWSVATSVQNAFFRLYLKASASPTTSAHTDYTDTLTFVATGTF